MRIVQGEDLDDGWDPTLWCSECFYYVDNDWGPDGAWHVDGDRDKPVTWELPDALPDGPPDNPDALRAWARYARLVRYKELNLVVQILLDHAGDDDRIAALERRADELDRGQGPPAGAVSWTGRATWHTASDHPDTIPVPSVAETLDGGS